MPIPLSDGMIKISKKNLDKGLKIMYFFLQTKQCLNPPEAGNKSHAPEGSQGRDGVPWK